MQSVGRGLRKQRGSWCGFDSGAGGPGEEGGEPGDTRGRGLSLVGSRMLRLAVLGELRGPRPPWCPTPDHHPLPPILSLFHRPLFFPLPEPQRATGPSLQLPLWEMCA